MIFFSIFRQNMPSVLLELNSEKVNMEDDLTIQVFDSQVKDEVFAYSPRAAV